MGNSIDSILFQPPVPSRLKGDKIVWIKTSTGTKIPTFFIEYTASGKPLNQNITLLYSHANAEDLGNIYPWCKFLSKQLKVNVLAYDYTGYGLAMDQGPATEDQCYRDIEAAFKHLRLELEIPSHRIVLYGRSLGGGVSTFLAANYGETNQNLGGLILHASFLSVYRIVIDSGCTLPGDQFVNIDICSGIRAPTLVIHGKKDNVVPFSHAEELQNALNEECKTNPLFIDSMGHNNVQPQARPIFIRHIDKFLNDHVRFRKSKSMKQTGDAHQLNAKTNTRH